MMPMSATQRWRNWRPQEARTIDSGRRDDDWIGRMSGPHDTGVTALDTAAPTGAAASGTKGNGTVVDASGTLQLGRLVVGRLGFGTMQLTGPGVWGPPADHTGAIGVLQRAVA